MASVLSFKIYFLSFNSFQKLVQLSPNHQLNGHRLLSERDNKISELYSKISDLQDAFVVSKRRKDSAGGNVESY